MKEDKRRSSISCCHWTMTLIKSAIPHLTWAVITCWDETCFSLSLEPFCDCLCLQPVKRYIFNMEKIEGGKRFTILLKPIRSSITYILQADSLSLTNSHMIKRQWFEKKKKIFKNGNRNGKTWRIMLQCQTCNWKILKCC